MARKIISLKENRELSCGHSQIVKEIWPPIMLSSEIADKCWSKLEEYFPEYQIFFTNNNDIIGFANTIPFYFAKKINNLPNTGWDWLIQKGIADYENKIKPNCLGGLQIGVAKKYQRKGFSKKIIEYSKKLSQDMGLKRFIIPIRPVLKCKYPLIDLKEYINWKKDGKVFDPWIRVHLKCGAEIIKICDKSMEITGSIDQWEMFFGLPIVGSGKYIISGAVSPVEIDVEKNIGKYFDENIWIYY